MSRPIVLQVFPMLDPSGEELLREHVDLRTATAPDPDTLAAEAVGAVALVARSPARIGGDLLDRLPDLLLVSATGSGADCFDVPAASQRGIPVLHNPGVAPGAVSEYVIATAVFLLRRLGDADAFLRAGGPWDPKDRFKGRELAGRTLGTVGFGSIGSDLARRATGALGVRVLAFDPYVPRATIEAAGATPVPRLHDLLAASDVVSLHVPSTPQTHQLIGAPELAAMRPDAILVSVARGSVVDEAALVRALGERRIAGAAVDVFDPEPPARDHPLFSLPNVLVTPHVAGLTEESVGRLAKTIARNLLGALRGERPAHLVDPEAWPPRRAERWPLDPDRSHVT